MEISRLERDGGMGAEGQMDTRPGCLLPFPLCTQGLPAPMCALQLLAAFLPCVSTPLWPISSIFITFCNARSRVPNLKSTLFPNVFLTSIPGPSGRAFPNTELQLGKLGAWHSARGTQSLPFSPAHTLHSALGSVQRCLAYKKPWLHLLLHLAMLRHLLLSRL